MKKKLKILHLASFTGNIGDNANHSGTYKFFSEYLDYTPEFTQLEMRRFFWKELSFDTDFVEAANQHDLVVVGGGNYFELWVENSRTGTSFDISLSALKRVKTPILFYGLGVDPGQGVPEKNKRNFIEFISYLNDSPEKYILTVRNDGALSNISKHIGPEYVKYFTEIADGGFFSTVRPSYHPEIDEKKLNIAVNIANDMPEHRFGSSETKDKITYQVFQQSLSKVLERIVKEYDDVRIIFYPHIYRDIQAIADILDNSNDRIRRSNYSVAPYLQGDSGQSYIFDSYNHCDLVLGMRFHSNVCAIGQSIPSIGLVNYPQIEKLYQGLGIEDRAVHVDNPDFCEPLMSLVKSTLTNNADIKKQYQGINLELKQKQVKFFHMLNDWLHK